MTTPRIGIIGGSGLYHIEGFTNQKWVRVKTPFGAPSDELDSATPPPPGFQVAELRQMVDDLGHMVVGNPVGVRDFLDAKGLPLQRRKHQNAERVITEQA